ncbi:oxidoreductase [Flavisolibacter ginsenosidimutans]|uniref:Oxidoreductase n=1 Tax=Flavisolibacter ginsenosidimutans TaxID=661481 RepID=A0A5B8UEX5_9BACT|nr:oxidoreductase [Flavisolibacter ginsenosidimutans]QEC54660.1 oxidoreductase [Flavisolibacter ginsenosidimutans]
MKKLCFLLSFLVALTSFAQTPKIEALTSGKKTSLRGLSVVTDNVLWVSGSNGTVGTSLNGGKDWKWFQVKGFEKADFRDIEAFDGATAIVMSVDTPAYILRTTDGGYNWKVVYENHKPGMFLDAMEFWNSESGIVVGDPIDGKIFIARTFDGGYSWKELPEQYKPKAEKDEACFAASGTNVRALDRDEAVFVTGGASSNVFIRADKIRLPIVQGKETTGANSIAVWDNKKENGGKKMIVVGGDFSKDSSSLNNCFYSNNRGKSWTAPKAPPHGYKSCVEYITEKHLVTCGTSSVDYSTDGGETWSLLSKEGYHVVRKAKDGTAVYLAGSNGKVAKFVE